MKSQTYFLILMIVLTLAAVLANTGCSSLDENRPDWKENCKWSDETQTFNCSYTPFSYQRPLK